MVDTPSQSPSSPLNKAVKPVGGATALIIAAAAAISSFTSKSEGTLYKAYLDPAGIPTICNGHTKGVKLGMTATPEQCKQMLTDDMVDHMKAIAKVSPNLVNHPNILKAGGDFAFNAGVGAWSRSPMRIHFDRGEYTEACNAFSGYYAAATFSRPQSRYDCRPKAGAPGKWLCNLPGLMTRRQHEKEICLNGKES